MPKFDHVTIDLFGTSATVMTEEGTVYHFSLEQNSCYVQEKKKRQRKFRDHGVMKTDLSDETKIKFEPLSEFGICISDR